MAFGYYTSYSFKSICIQTDFTVGMPKQWCVWVCVILEYFRIFLLDILLSMSIVLWVCN